MRCIEKHGGDGATSLVKLISGDSLVDLSCVQRSDAHTRSAAYKIASSVVRVERQPRNPNT